MDQPSPTIEQQFAVMFQGLNLLGNAFLQLDAQFDTLKAILVELHPELEGQLEERIRKAQADSVRKFATLQQMIELLRTTGSGPVQ